MAAKGKYTERTITALIAALELGATHARACDAAGIDKSTFYEWLNTKAAFSDRIKAAEAVCVERCLEAIKAAAKDGTWQAAAWVLERRYPQEYGRTVQEHQGELRVDVRYTNDWRGGGGDDSTNA